MRRKLLIITALCLFVGAGAAFAATSDNIYTGTNLSFTHGSGSAKKPVPIGFTEALQANNKDPTKAAAVLTKIVVKIYGVKSNSKPFPTCTQYEDGGAEVRLLLPEEVQVCHRPGQLSARQPEPVVEQPHQVQPESGRVQRRAWQAVVLLHHPLGAFSALACRLAQRSPTPDSSRSRASTRSPRCPCRRISRRWCRTRRTSTGR